MNEQYHVFFEALLDGKTNLEGISKQELVALYLEARDAKDEAAEIASKFEKVISIVSDALNVQMGQEDLKNFRTDLGTVTRKPDFNIGCADWPRFWEYMYQEAKRKEAAGEYHLEVFSMLHKRVSKEPIVTFLENPIIDEEGVPHVNLPPGINVTPKHSIQVRRTNK